MNQDNYNCNWSNTIPTKRIEARLRRLNKRISKGKYVDKTQLTYAKNSLYSLQLKTKITASEKIFGDYLCENKIYFKFQKGFITPFHRIVDFYLPQINLIIEVDGGYHVNTIEKDSNKDYLWKKYRDMDTLRISNEQILDGSFKEIAIIKNLSTGHY